MSISNENDEVKVVTPPNTVKEKIGAGGFDPDNVKKAEKTMAEEKPNFEDVAESDIKIIEEAIREGKAGHKKPEQVIREVNAAAFELKANGGMYDYPLVTDVATSLFQLTDMAEDVDESVFEVLTLHYQAIRAAMALRGKADKPEDAKALIKGLMAASNKVIKF